MLTILQIIPNLGAGGAEQACVDVAAHLVAEGHQALVVSSGGPRVTEIEQSGGTHLLRNVRTKNPFRIAQNALWLAALIRAHKIDAVHARSRAPAWSAYLACRMTGCAFITTFHAAYKYKSGIKKAYNAVMAKADRIIAISDFIAVHIRESYGVAPERIHTIPRGIDLDQFQTDKITEERRTALRQAWGITAKDGLILLPSRVSPIKGQATLIEAMALLPDTLKHLTAVIVGDDQGRVGYRQELEKLITTKALQDSVRMVAHCRDMPAAYNLASLVVATSRVPEGFGRVPVEAMAMGIPVVATRLGAFTETIRDGETGFLVPPNDAQALAVAITRIFSQTPTERATMSAAAQNQVRARYDKNKMVAATLAVYKEVTSKKANDHVV